MEAGNIEFYTTAIGSDFVETCHYSGTIRPQERDRIRSIQVLNDMLTGDYIRKRCFTPVFHSLEEEIGDEMKMLVTHIKQSTP